MTRAGDARPIRIPFATASVVTPWLQRVRNAHSDHRVIIGGKFWADHTKELIEFTRKLERGWMRVRDQRCDALTLWTVKRTEALAACGYLKLTWRAWRCADSPISNALGFSALHVALILHKVLDWTRGQPRRTAAQASRLLDEYRRTPSSERCKYSGLRIREARQQVEDAAILEEIIAEYRQYEDAIPPGSDGDELLRLMRERGTSTSQATVFSATRCTGQSRAR